MANREPWQVSHADSLLPKLHRQANKNCFPTKEKQNSHIIKMNDDMTNYFAKKRVTQVTQDLADGKGPRTFFCVDGKELKPSEWCTREVLNGLETPSPIIEEMRAANRQAERMLILWVAAVCGWLAFLAVIVVSAMR